MINPTIARKIDMQASEINDMIDDIVKPPYVKCSILYKHYTAFSICYLYDVKIAILQVRFPAGRA